MIVVVFDSSCVFEKWIFYCFLVCLGWGDNENKFFNSGVLLEGLLIFICVCCGKGNLYC